MVKEFELEHFEQKLATFTGKRVMVQVPLFGGVGFSVVGEIHTQLDVESDPQFNVFSNGNSNCLTFYVKDVEKVITQCEELPCIVLKAYLPAVCELLRDGGVNE